LLDKYEKRYYACMDPVTKKLIKEIDDILEWGDFNGYAHWWKRKL
jgi:hypothetical protein